VYRLNARSGACQLPFFPLSLKIYCRRSIGSRTLLRLIFRRQSLLGVLQRKLEAHTRLARRFELQLDRFTPSPHFITVVL